uniref:Secreted protein n=1 Tax=Rhipicephalus appendiculatus TaxID=34631 RepID=A0A131YD26_RHIAP
MRYAVSCFCLSLLGSIRVAHLLAEVSGLPSNYKNGYNKQLYGGANTAVGFHLVRKHIVVSQYTESLNMCAGSNNAGSVIFCDSLCTQAAHKSAITFHLLLICWRKADFRTSIYY